MADVGRLRWVLTADTRQFDQALRRTASGLRRLGRLAAAGLGARGVGRMLQNAVSTADAMGKMAAAAGVNVETLQALRHAADLAGIATEGFDESLLRFVNRLGQLQMHQGPLFTFLRRYDVELLRTLMRTEDTTVAFARLAEAVRRAPSRQLQQALSFQATGNRRMVGLLRGGAPGLAAGVQSALANVNMLTTQQVQRMEQVQDAMTRANERFNTEISATLVRIVEMIGRTLSKIDGFIDKISLRTLGENLLEGAAGLGRFMFPSIGRGRTSE